MPKNKTRGNNIGPNGPNIVTPSFIFWHMWFDRSLYWHNTKSMASILKGIYSRYKASKLLYRANKQIERANTLSLEIRANNVPHFLFRIFQQEKKYIFSVKLYEKIFSKIPCKSAYIVQTNQRIQRGWEDFYYWLRHL